MLVNSDFLRLPFRASNSAGSAFGRFKNVFTSILREESQRRIQTTRHHLRKPHQILLKRQFSAEETINVE